VTDTSTPDSSVSAESPSPEASAPEETTEETKKSETVTSESDLFRQSEIAADYVEGLLDILDYDGDIDELVSAGRPMVEVVGGRLQPLVGQRGATLEALQELTRLAIFRATGSMSSMGAPPGRRVPNRTPRTPLSLSRFSSSEPTDRSSITIPRAVGPNCARDSISRRLSVP